MLSKSVVIKPTRYFNSSKEKTYKYFKESKVNSCSHVLVKNGQSLAVSYNIVNAKGIRMNSFKLLPSSVNNYKSVYQMDYTRKPYMHAGMKHKPLVPYNPSSYRSRLPISDFAMGYSNKSGFELGDSGLINRKQWVSTSKDTYTYPMLSPISNTGILADLAKHSHKKLEAIN